jgi:hypothetical protein
MARFDASIYYKTLASGAFNIWDVTPSNMRFNVPSATTVIVDSSLEANLPMMAQTYLGDQHLWWVILYYNGITDPLSDVYTLKVLNIPDRQTLISYLERVLPGYSNRVIESTKVEIEPNPQPTPIPNYLQPFPA